MKKYIYIIVAFITFSCSSDSSEIIPINPEFSSTLLNIEEGQTEEVQITKGEGPFSVESVDQKIARVSVKGNTITILAESKGNTKIRVVGSDRGESFLNVIVEENRYKGFLEDAILRFERANIPTIKNISGEYLFYKDKGLLFGSTKNKIGYGKRDGSAFYILEWEGDNSVGIKNNATIRDVLGVIPIARLEVLKYDNNIIWIVYQEKVDGPEEKAVQKF